MTSSTKELFKKKNISWYAWNFGIEFLIVNASIYFSEWLVVENKIPDFWYSLAFISSTIALIFISPYLGVVLDRKGKRVKVFLYLTSLTLVSGALVEVFAKSNPFLVRIALTLIFFALLNFFYQLAGLVFNTFLKDISKPSTAGKVAGIASGFSTIGDALGLLITLPIILGVVKVFGTSRISVLIPMAVLAAIFCLPIYGAFKHQKDEVAELPESSGKYKQIWNDLKDTKTYPGVLRLLIAFYFYNDAILTLQLFAAIYLEKVYHIPDAKKVIIVMIVYLSFTLGAWIGGYFGDKLGNKKALMFGVLVTGLMTAIISLANAGLIVYILFGLFGAGTGISFACTKALFSNLIPYAKKAQFFGLYSISEKFASIVGPATWGIVAYFVSSKNGLNYRMAALAMSLFLFIGAFIVRKVKDVVSINE